MITLWHLLKGAKEGQQRGWRVHSARSSKLNARASPPTGTVTLLPLEAVAAARWVPFNASPGAMKRGAAYDGALTDAFAISKHPRPGSKAGCALRVQVAWGRQSHAGTAPGRD